MVVFLTEFPGSFQNMTPAGMAERGVLLGELVNILRCLVTECFRPWGSCVAQCHVFVQLKKDLTEKVKINVKIVFSRVKNFQSTV